MKIARYDPFSTLEELDRDLGKLWHESWGSFPALMEVPEMDMYEKDSKLITEVSLPSFSKEEIKVDTDSGMLEITAKHEEKKSEKDKRRYLMRESRNQYYRRVALPEGADADKAKAEFKSGELTITMPFKAAKKPKSISIK